MSNPPVSSNRLDASVRPGRIDRSRTVRCTFDGVELHGHPGDTLASALLAEGRIEAAPSSHRGRRRGIVAADRTEPNAFVRLLGDPAEPVLPATRVELRDGLEAESPSGFGRVGRQPDPAVQDERYVHADVVVVGAGPAGLAAALAAGRSGARVFLVDEQCEFGGTLFDGQHRIEGRPAGEWIADAVRELFELPETRMLTRATAVDHHDHGHLLVVERCGERRGDRGADEPHRRLWHVRAQRIVLATGAHERPLVFADNDRPGIMLASAVRHYINRRAVLPGRDAVVFTTSDSAYATALDLLAVGARVPAVVDTRPVPPERLAERVRAAGGTVYAGSAVVATEGADRVCRVRISAIDDGGTPTGTARDMPCDLLAVCGGWNPVVHLLARAGGSLRWDRTAGGFVPASSGGQLPKVIGAARGTYDLAGCLSQGLAAGAEAATASGFRIAAPHVPGAEGDRPCTRPRPLWCVPAESGVSEEWRTHFVDLRCDATVADVRSALGTGAHSVERIKHHITSTTGAGQDGTSEVNTIGVIAEALSAASPGEVDTPVLPPP